MDLLKLTERAAHTLKSCELLTADSENENHQRSFAADLDALRKHPPTSPPVLVGMFNQCVAYGDQVLDAVAQERTSPAAEAKDRLRRSVKRLQDCLTDLHAGAARRTGAIGRPAANSPSPERKPLQRA